MVSEGADSNNVWQGKETSDLSSWPSYTMDIQETLSQGVKGPDLTADHSSPFSADIKNKWNIPPLPEYAFMACKLYLDGECYVNPRWCLRIQQ